ncbi:unnamed protein product [Linum trigynum]|uniref:Uncharacterized protein n=1 Tax=Linum trigynum TaxID=586398 RepID=A0AAV2DVF6_9ROSI
MESERGESERGFYGGESEWRAVAGSGEAVEQGRPRRRLWSRGGEVAAAGLRAEAAGREARRRRVGRAEVAGVEWGEGAGVYGWRGERRLCLRQNGEVGGG